MSFQIKVFIGLTTSVAALWSGRVYRDRQFKPQGRYRHFTPGSADDVLSSSLKTGDVILFGSDCTLYYPCGALECFLSKRATQSRYNHIGIVVLKLGEPYVAELFDGTVRMRPFDERLMCSRAHEVVVLPLKRMLSSEQKEQIEAGIKNWHNSVMPTCLTSIYTNAKLSSGNPETAASTFVQKVLYDAHVTSERNASSLNELAQLVMKGKLQQNTQFEEPVWYRARA